MRLNGTPLGNVNMPCIQRTQVTTLKYMESTLLSVGVMDAEVEKSTQCGWNNWNNMPGVICDKMIPPHVKEPLHTMTVQSGMQYDMETVPMSSSHVNKLEVIYMKTCR